MFMTLWWCGTPPQRRPGVIGFSPAPNRIRKSGRCYLSASENFISSVSLIEQARESLKKNDTEVAFTLLLEASNGAHGEMHSIPGLLPTFEDLFRTKISITENCKDDNLDSALSIVLDRMGLASLLSDQGRYQEAVQELEQAVQKTKENNHAHIPQGIADKAMSMWFRSKAAICDWSDYAEASEHLVEKIRDALEDEDATTPSTPAVHPFEALTWPCINLEESTRVAHAYAVRAMGDSERNHNTVLQNRQYPWQNLEERLSRTHFDSVTVDASFSQTNSTTIGRSIRLGYISPDFTGKHPLAFLMQDVFRFHDPDNFEVYLYSLEESDASAEVEKILAAGKWTVLRGSTESMAKTIENDNLDILIDLCGYTGTSTIAQIMCLLKNLELYENNAAQQCISPPIHVAYMGYPGSSGAPYIDYMIADTTVIPSHLRQYYSESILFMPHCYFVNSHQFLMAQNDRNHEESIVSDKLPSQSRSGYDLPKSAFVFCCHSRPDKIDPGTFKTWVQALQKTRRQGRQMLRQDMGDAVLWLLRSDPIMEENLRRSAAFIWNNGMINSGSGSDGMDEKFPQDSLVFCDKAPRDEHLQRLSLANVFLDTPAYNAHTVGCDCLAVGVPMISLLRQNDHGRDGGGGSVSNMDNSSTVETEKLASRVGASLLKSVGGGLELRLVVPTMDEFEQCMIDCAQNGLAKEQQHLEQVVGGGSGNDIAPLWDTERWVKNLEAGLQEMLSLQDVKSSNNVHVDIFVVDDD
jgi:protein O-GlcNAc transferase